MKVRDSKLAIAILGIFSVFFHTTKSLQTRLALAGLARNQGHNPWKPKSASLKKMRAKNNEKKNKTASFCCDSETHMMNFPAIQWLRKHVHIRKNFQLYRRTES